MKRIFILIATFGCIHSMAQSIPRTGNYQGVNAVFNNPASIAGSNYRVDLNLVSINAYSATDHAFFQLKNFNADSTRNQFLKTNGGLVNGFATIDMKGPSLLISGSKNSGLAFTTRSRAFINLKSFDGKLVNELVARADEQQRYPFELASTANMEMVMNAWTEYGVSYAHTILDRGKHLLRAGATFKYLGGVASGYVHFKNLQGSVNQEDTWSGPYLQNSSGQLNLTFVGPDMNNFKFNDLLHPESSGFGADIGLVYEYHPGNDKSEEEEEKPGENYRLQFSVALLDIGKIHYKNKTGNSGSYQIGIQDDERFYFNQFDGVKPRNIVSVLNSHPDLFEPQPGNVVADYKFALPTVINLGLDYHITKGWYVNVNGRMPLIKEDSRKPFNTILRSSFNITPRVEGRHFGVYLPVHYYSQSGLNAGAALRWGGIYLGSSSLVSALFHKTKQVDLEMGYKISFLKKS